MHRYRYDDAFDDVVRDTGSKIKRIINHHKTSAYDV